MLSRCATFFLKNETLKNIPFIQKFVLYSWPKCYRLQKNLKSLLGERFFKYISYFVRGVFITM